MNIDMNKSKYIIDGLNSEFDQSENSQYVNEYYNFNNRRRD